MPDIGFKHDEAIFAEGKLVGFRISLDFNLLTKTLGDRFDSTMREFANELESEVKARSPVSTGLNRDSIKMTVTGSGMSMKGQLETGSGYGGWLEIGTKKRPKTPYIRPAWKKAKKLFFQRLTNSI